MKQHLEEAHVVVTEGWAPRTSKGKVLACLLEQTRLKKVDIGKIELDDGCARVEWLGQDSEQLRQGLKGISHIIADERKVFCWSTATGKQLRAWSEKVTHSLERAAEVERNELERNTPGFRARRVDTDWNHLDQPIWTLEGVKGKAEAASWLRPWQGVKLISGYREIEGRMIEITGHRVQVLLPEASDDEQEETWELFPAFHELAHRRRMRAVDRMPFFMTRNQETANGDRGSAVKDRNDLNSLQNLALQKSMTEGILLIHGPPGTGKTYLLGAMIASLIAQGNRVLACTASHSATDHLAKAAVEHGVEPVRLGLQERVSEDIREYHLQERLEKDAEVKLGRNMMKDAKKQMASKSVGKDEMRNARELLSQGRQLLRRRRKDIIEGASLLVSTLAHLDPVLYGDLDMDVVIVDEAGQCLEPEAWQGLCMGKRWILAGDPQQLPATVKVKNSVLEVSLLERWMKENFLCVSLREQYRMAPVLMNFPSSYFYNDQLVAAPCTEELAEKSLLRYVDMAGAGGGEEERGNSLCNREEKNFLLAEVERHLNNGVLASEIGVISPYRGQVEELESSLNAKGVEVRSIDGFQGREKEVMIISLVRSNMEGHLGFLKDYRRMNVALTRAKRVLIVLGDSSTLSGDPFYSQWLDHIEVEGEYRSCFEWGEGI